MAVRYFLAFLTAAALVCGCANTGASASGSAANGAAPSAKATSGQKPRKIGVQMYTFHKYTLEDSIPLLKSVGVDAMGLTRGQKLSAKCQKNIGPDLNKQERAYLKELLKKNGMKAVSYGVANGGDEKGIDAIAEFVKDVGIPIVLTEDKPKLIPYWDKVAEKNGFIVCIHNHDSTQMKANRYFNPLVVKKTIGKCKNVFACPDNGHWSRSAVDGKWGYKTLAGKIRIVHFKDQKEFGNLKNQPVPFGEGELDCKGLLEILDSQGFDGYFLIEHETDWDNNLPAVKKCVDFLKNN